MPELTYHIINAFGDTQHGSGNPAAVVITPEPLDDEALSILARDFYLPMTCFLTPLSGIRYIARFFTPGGSEVPLCGHASLGAGTVLLQATSAQTVALETKLGEIAIDLIGDRANGAAMRMWLPLPPPPEAIVSDELGLGETVASALGISHSAIQSVSAVGTTSVVAEISPNIPLKDLVVNTAALKKFGRTTVVQILSEGESLKLRTRVFIPAFGIDEDPVCGSAHAELTALYITGAGRGRFPNATELDVNQVSPRGGFMKWSVDGSRAVVQGRAWSWATGKLDV